MIPFRCLFFFEFFFGYRKTDNFIALNFSCCQLSGVIPCGIESYSAWNDFVGIEIEVKWKSRKLQSFRVRVGNGEEFFKKKQ